MIPEKIKTHVSQPKRCGWCGRQVAPQLIMARLETGLEVCLCCLNNQVRVPARGLK